MSKFTPLVFGLFLGCTSPALAHAAEAPVVMRRVVHFKGPIQSAWRAALAAHNIVVRGYEPPDAFAILADTAALAWLSHEPYVAGIDAPASDARGRGVSRIAVAADAGGDAGASPFAVRLLRAEDADAVRQAILAAGGRIEPQAEGLGASATILDVELTAGQAQLLAQDLRVEAVESRERMKVFNDLAYGVVQSGVVHNATVWAAGLHGEGQVVGVADVGVAGDSCYFSGDKIVSQTVLYSADHSHLHGTHTAGSIAGDSYHNGLFDNHDGMAPAARLVVQDAGTRGTGDLQVPSDLGSLLEPPYKAGARIHSDSWGGTDRGYGVKERSLDAFVAAHPDMLVVLAAGNEGKVGSSASPTTAKNIIVVGALDSTALDDVADFSSRGPTQDGRIRPHVVAPGVGVVSAKAGSSCDTTVLSGTSMAAPMVAGAAALARQYYTEGFYPTGKKTAGRGFNPSAALLKATLMAGAQPMLGDNPQGVLPAPSQGYGRMQLDGALYLGGNGPRVFVRDDPGGLAPQDTYTTQFTTSGGPVRIALAWTDPPASEGSRQTLVDDLDLELDGPDGQVRWGNGGQAKGGPESAADHLNNEEVINLSSLPAGTYTLKVHGWNVPMGPQSFALVAVANFSSFPQAGLVTDARGAKVERNAGADGGAEGCQAVHADASMWALVGGLGLLVARRRRTPA